MERISANLLRGDKIIFLEELVALAKEGKSVCFRHGMIGVWIVRPAAFMVHWSVAMLSEVAIFKTIKQ